MGVAKAKRQCGRQKCFLRCLFYVLKYKTAYTFLLSIVVSINAAFPRLPLVPRGHVLSLYEERTQRRTKEKNRGFLSLARLCFLSSREERKCPPRHERQTRGYEMTDYTAIHKKFTKLFVLKILNQIYSM